MIDGGIREFADVAELERIATEGWSSGVRAFVQAGAGDGRGIRANRAAHAKWSLRARVLVDVSCVDTATTALGVPLDLPMMIAPSAVHTLVWPEGEVATARGARDANTIMVLSSATGRSIEDVTAVGGNLWFQLYWGSDRAEVRRLIDLAADRGCRALCLTVDMPVPPLLGSEMRRGVAGVAHVRPKYLPPHGGSLTGAWAHDQRLSWRDLAWLRDVCDLPIVIKGIMAAEDAVCAAECGADGIVVSNHGGRALDTPVGTMDVLPAIVAALDQANAHTDVFVDGGFRHGSEIVVALALGARAVLIGRPALWALAVGGAPAVTRLIKLMGHELSSTMARVGSTAISEIDVSRIGAASSIQEIV